MIDTSQTQEHAGQFRDEICNCTGVKILHHKGITSGCVFGPADSPMTHTAETPRSPEAVPHQTVPMLVWADIDVGIADMVRYLNTIPGVRTEASCQGGTSYRPQVLTIWPKEQEARLLAEFDVHETNRGECWGYLHPRDGWVAPLAREAPKAVDIDELAVRFEDCWNSTDTRTALREVVIPYLQSHASPVTAGVDDAIRSLAKEWRNAATACDKAIEYEGASFVAKSLRDNADQLLRILK